VVGVAGAPGAAGAAPQQSLAVSQQSFFLWKRAFSRSSRLGFAHGSQPQSSFFRDLWHFGPQSLWHAGAGAGQQTGAGAGAGAQQVGAGLAHGSQHESAFLLLCRAIRALILSQQLTRAHGSQHDAAGAAQPPQSPPATKADVMRMRVAVTVKHLRRTGIGTVRSNGRTTCADGLAELFGRIPRSPPDGGRENGRVRSLRSHRLPFNGGMNDLNQT
jgi:hypothetical protein